MKYKKRNTEIFISEMSEINTNIEILGKYTRLCDRVESKCLVCGHIWNPTASALLNGRGCPKCYGYITKDEYIEKLHTKFPHIDLIGDYFGTHHKTLFKCNKHNITYESRPKDILYTVNGSCPLCRSEKQSNDQTWSNEQYIERLSNLTDSIIPLEKYIMSCVKIKHKCLKCGNEWCDSPGNLLNYPTCPMCEGSKGEMRIFKYLKDNLINFEFQKGFDDLKYIKSLFYDFYLPNHNLLIEYDGEFHFKPIFSEESFLIEQKRDATKNEYALYKDIRLLRIPYWEFDNIETILSKTLNIGGS